MKCLYPIYTKKGNVVPCGKCAPCLLNQAQEWTLRLSAENQRHNAYFVTLTYDDVHLPINGVDKHGVQCFLKRLRHELPFKYYLISEYGPHTHRPHYHAIFYADVDNDTLYDCILRNWKQGNIKVDDVNGNRINYVSSYHVTKGICPRDKTENFRLASKGLGSCFLTKNRIKFFIDNTVNTTKYLGFRMALPRYYKEKVIYTDNQKEYFKSVANAYYDSTRSYLEIRRLKQWEKNVFRKKFEKKNKI